MPGDPFFEVGGAAALGLLPEQSSGSPFSFHVATAPPHPKSDADEKFEDVTFKPLINSFLDESKLRPVYLPISTAPKSIIENGFPFPLCFCLLHV